MIFLIAASPILVVEALLSYVVAFDLVMDVDGPMILNHPFKPLWLRWPFLALAPITVPVSLVIALIWG